MGDKYKLDMVPHLKKATHTAFNLMRWLRSVNKSTKVIMWTTLGSLNVSFQQDVQAYHNQVFESRKQQLFLFLQASRNQLDI